jgi:hypothetical protein
VLESVASDHVTALCNADLHVDASRKALSLTRR